jgi:hypothetical protein
MGVGRWVAVLGALAALQSGEARAIDCLACGTDMFCYTSAVGGYVCIGNGDACLMGGRCRAGFPGVEYESYGMIQLTVLEDAPELGRIGGARVVRDAGPLSVGRHSSRVARAAAGGAASAGEIVFSGVGAGEGATVAFRSRLGDGFTLRRDADGRGALVTVRAVLGGRPDRVLARERLDENDALAVRVTLEGRPRVVIVQAPTLDPAEGATRDAAARAELRGANGSRPGRFDPPFEMTPVLE